MHHKVAKSIGVVALLVISVFYLSTNMNLSMNQNTEVINERTDYIQMATRGAFSYFYENIGQIADDTSLYYGSFENDKITFHPGSVHYRLGDTEESIITFNTENEINPLGMGESNHASNFILGDRGTYLGAKSFRYIVYPELWPGVSLIYEINEMKIDHMFVMESINFVERIDVFSDDNQLIPISEPYSFELPLDLMLPHPVIGACKLLFDPLGGEETSTGYDSDSSFSSSNSVDWNETIIFGGEESDSAFTIATDASGDIYVAGTTWSQEFTMLENISSINTSESDCFIVKLDIQENEIGYLTFIGGEGKDSISSLSVDIGGMAVLVGNTDSEDFPLMNPLIDEFSGGLSDCFILRLNGQGNRVLFSTYFGNDGNDYVEGMYIDTLGTVYITGFTSSEYFPTENAYDELFNGGYFDCFVSAITRNGELKFSTFVGGDRADHGIAIALDSEDSIYVTGYTFSGRFPVSYAFDSTYNGGSDIFVFKLSQDGQRLEYSTFVGGSWVERPSSLAVDSLGQVFVTGTVYSQDFPVVNAFNATHSGGADIFVFKLDNTGSAMHYSTFIGGEGDDYATWIDVDDSGFAYVTGYSNSQQFPLAGEGASSSNSKEPQAFLLKLDNDGDKLLFSTFLGNYDERSYAFGLFVDSSGNAYVSGCTHMGPNEQLDGFAIRILDIGDSDNDNITDYLEDQLGLDRHNNDTDADNLSDGYELFILGTDPLNNDSDNDNVIDGDEKLIYNTNPLNNDTDSDSLTDGYELFVSGTRPLNNDSDSDNLSDYEEIYVYLTNPLIRDSDFDSLEDGLEVHTYGTLPNNNDTDNDNLDDAQEIFVYHTLANNSDTDADSISDGDEILVYGTSPLSNDTDSDGLLDYDELTIYGTSMTLWDSDSDSVSDGAEVLLYLTDPLENDTDSDLMPDGWEIRYGLNPLLDDSAGDLDVDGISNIDEFRNSTSPISNDTDEDTLLDYDEIHTYLTNPNSTDSDGDQLLDQDEINTYLTLPNNTDSDNDDMDDGWEVLYGLDPNLDDSADDFDLDGLTNYYEYQIGTNPASNDSDGDTLLDEDELLIHSTNPAEADSDFDGIDDNIELGTTDPTNPDSDNDSIIDGDEIGVYFTNPNNNDTDSDLMPDGWEISYGLNPLIDDSSNDTDLDGINNLNEYLNGTNPISNDTDLDTLLDLDEIQMFGTSPTNDDSDGDGMPDDWEILYSLNATKASSGEDADSDGLTDILEFSENTNPTLNDTDADSLLDGAEFNTHGTSPSNNDTDADNLLDGEELNIYFTDPLIADSDFDEMIDGWEVLYGLDPNFDDALNDPDRDGLLNIEEYVLGGNPIKLDGDKDGITDADEAFVYRTQLNNSDTDSDLMRDGWETKYDLDPLVDDSALDPDNDTLSNLEEFNSGANPLKSDSDNDNLSDADEVFVYKSSPTNIDSDEDGLDDFLEATLYHTNLTSSDTDNDEMPDPWEVLFGLNPLVPSAEADFDGDGILNLEEFQVGSHPNSTDSDNDDLDDFSELREHGTNPSSNDTDSDALDDYAEIYTYGTDPLNRDSDGDNLRDGYEVLFHLTDPLNADSDFDGMDDGWELLYHLDPFHDDSNLDYDYDGLTNMEELEFGTSASSKDTDADGLNDLFEIRSLGTSPVNIDSDGDLLPDDWEFNYGLNPTVPDSANDPDSDSLTNLEEYEWQTNPNSDDSDSDGIKDGIEVHTYQTNPVSSDSDSDELSDKIEIEQYRTDPNKYDSDSDGLGDGFEINDIGTDPLNNDSDADGLPDKWEWTHDTSPLQDDSEEDLDEDGLTNEEEYLLGTHPNRTDSDNDGLDDAFEVSLGTNPSNSDSDRDNMADEWEYLNHLDPLVDDSNEDQDTDTLTNLQEYQYNTNPNSIDSDGDTLSDADEIELYFTDPNLADSDSDGLDDASEILVYGTNPLNIDSDNDKLSDEFEVSLGTNPLLADSDGDTFRDGWEIQNGFDPLNPEVPVVELLLYNLVYVGFSIVGIVSIVAVILKRTEIKGILGKLSDQVLAKYRKSVLH